MSRFALIFALTLLFISPFASAEIPHLISLQGKLTDATDNPISSSTNFVFRIYNASLGGALVWNETQNSIVPDSNGIFSALLGSATALNIPFNESYWLEVQVNSEILSPRTRMGSAGYAIRSENSGNTTGNIIYMTGTGNVGIGTENPTAKLYVKTTDSTTVPLQVESLINSDATWWNISYPYRKAITVAGSTSALADYQVGYNVTYVSGMKPDFSDLRFVQSGAWSPMPYWIESSATSSWAYVWFKANLNTGNNKIYMYYGSPSAVSESNGTNTFDFFEGFEKYTVGTLNGQGGWSGYTDFKVINTDAKDGTKSAYLYNGLLSLPMPSISVSVPRNIGYIAEYWLKMTGPISQGTVRFYEGGSLITHLGGDNGAFYDSVGIIGGSFTSGHWYSMKLMIRPSPNTHDAYVDNGATLAATGRANNVAILAGINKIELVSDDRTNTIWDTIRLRKYASPEPSVGSTGSQETQNSPPSQQTVLYIQNGTGNIGIGKINPQYTLDVNGYVRAAGYYTGDIFFQKDGEKLWRMYEDDDGLYLEKLKTGKHYKFILEEIKK